MTHYTHWTPKMLAFLKKNYEWKGDKELAALFEKRFPKHFPWTSKQIEKRRSYSNMKRTREQLYYIHCQNQKDGRQKKMWDTRGRMQEGEVRTWDGRSYIKHNGKVIIHARYLANAKAGQIVRVHEGEISIIDRSQNQKLNAAIRKSKTPELKQAIKLLNRITKTIHAKQTNRPQ